MNEKLIRKEIRKVLRERMQQMHPAYPINGGDNFFPYEEEDEITRLPNDINTDDDYLFNWKGMSDNNDLYGFPMEEFVKGMQVEKTKNNMFNVIDVAEKVINNLKQNPQFYTNLGV